MLISYSNKFIFIHNYKVAGSSVKKALRGFSLNTPSKFHLVNRITEKSIPTAWLNYHLSKNISFIPSFQGHVSAAELEQQLPEKIWNKFYKFAFVRNPWDWHVSLYHFMLERKKHYRHEYIKNMESFEEFVERRVSLVNENLEGKHRQIDMICDSDNNILVDFVGKIENINHDFSIICDNLGINAPSIPKVNTSEHKKYQEYYSESSKNLIAECFKLDIELFDYKF